MKLAGAELAMAAAFLVAVGGMVAIGKWESIGEFLVILGMGGHQRQAVSRTARRAARLHGLRAKACDAMFRAERK